MKRLLKKIECGLLPILLIIAAVLCFTAGTAYALSGKPETFTINISVEYDQTDARSMLALVNAFREENGLKKLTYSGEMEKIAMLRAAELTLAMSHRRPSGVTGVKGTGENIAYSIGSSYPMENAFIDWREDDLPYDQQGHRRNMLNKDVTAIGISHVKFQANDYWVQVFGYEITDAGDPYDGSKTVTVEVKNSELAKAHSIECFPLEYTIRPGESANLPDVEAVLEFTLAPLYTVYKVYKWHSIPVEWTSGNTRVVKIEKDKIIGISNGTTELKGNLFGNPISVSVTVKGTPMPTPTPDPNNPDVQVFSIYRLNDDGTSTDVTKKTVEIDIAAGEMLTLKAVAPNNAYPNVTWKSSSSKTASFSASGNVVVVEGSKAGNTKITASYKNGNKTMSAVVTVKVLARVQPGSIAIIGGKSVAEKKTVKLAVNFNQSMQPTNKKVTWTTSDKAIATVSSAGVVKGVKQGNATIKACSKENDNICDTWEITVTPVTNKVEIIDLYDGSRLIDLAAVGSYELNARALNSEGTKDGIEQVFTWKSSSPKIAEVYQNGSVRGLKAGKVTITATANDGSKKSGKIVLQVRALPQPGSLEISGPSEIMVKKTGKLTVKFHQPVQPTGKKVTWSSSDPTIAKVTNTGAVKGLKAGTVTITAKSAEVPEVMESVKITIIPLEGKNSEAPMLNDELTMDALPDEELQEPNEMEESEPLNGTETDDGMDTSESGEGTSSMISGDGEEPARNEDEVLQQETVQEEGSAGENVKEEAAEGRTELSAEVTETEPEEEILTDNEEDSEVSELFDSEASEEDAAWMEYDLNAADNEEKPEEILIEINISDLNSEGLSGIVDSVIAIERDRFEVSDELFSTLTFEVENEEIAKLEECSAEERLMKGISIQLMSAGETNLVVRQEGKENVLLEVRISAAFAASEGFEELVDAEAPASEIDDEQEDLSETEKPADVTDEASTEDTETETPAEQLLEEKTELLSSETPETVPEEEQSE